MNQHHWLLNTSSNFFTFSYSDLTQPSSYRDLLKRSLCHELTPVATEQKQQFLYCDLTQPFSYSDLTQPSSYRDLR